MTLDQLPIGKTATITAVNGSGALRRHFLDMGLTPRTLVTLRKVAPMGDPIELELRGYELTLRLEDAKSIDIEGVHTRTPEEVEAEHHHQHDLRAVEPIAHPGLGEATTKRGRTANALPAGTPITFALAGNQNCGKTTLFNQLTGSNQHVGNFPGVTVDRKDGQIRKHPEATVVDLPGIYSLSPYSNEEIVTRDFLINERPQGIINIVDATNIERNLYLTMQLIELGIPVVPISAAKNEGIDELIEHAMQVAVNQEKPARVDFCAGAMHRCIHAICHLIEDHAQRARVPLRFAATKLVEGDVPMLERLHLSDNEKDLLEHAITEMEADLATDREAALADMRYAFIGALCEHTVIKKGESREHARSVKIDSLLTHRFLAIPIFLGIMGLVFWLTFGLIGQGLSDLLALGLDALTGVVDNALTTYGINPVVHSLVIDGIFAGVGNQQ